MDLFAPGTVLFLQLEFLSDKIKVSIYAFFLNLKERRCQAGAIGVKPVEGDAWK